MSANASLLHPFNRPLMRPSLRPLSSPRLSFAFVSSATTTRALARSIAPGLLTRLQQERSSSTQPTRPAPAYAGHIPLTWFESAFLTVGAAAILFNDPRRADLVAAVGETTAGPVLPLLRERMLECEEGRRILKDRPRINTRTLDMHVLAALPEGTLGREYITWLQRTGANPDTRKPVHYVYDPELAYIMQRYRESHDLYHTIFNLPTDHLSELAVKAFEAANLNLPMAFLAAFLQHVNLRGAKRHERYLREYLPWGILCGGSPRARCLISVYWEKRWAQPLDELKREFGVWNPPCDAEAQWKKIKGKVSASWEGTPVQT